MTTPKDFDLIENTNFVLTGRLTAPQLFSEGYTQLSFGHPLVKVLLHTVIDPKKGNDPEIRKASQYLTLPTVRAMELAYMILVAAKNSEERLMGDLSERDREKVRKILQNIQVGASAQDVEIATLPASPKAGDDVKGTSKVNLNAVLKKGVK